MDEFDDYFDDDLVLDEQTLAILDREEKKHFSHTERQPPPPPPAVTKKQKTRDGWSPGVGSRPREHDNDDLPEISVTVDGNYGFTDSTFAVGSSSSSHPPLRQANTPNPSQLKRQLLPNGHNLPRAPRTSTSAGPVLSQSRASPVPIPRQRNISPTSMFQHGTSNQVELQRQMVELQGQLRDLRNENQKFQAALKEAIDTKYAKEGEVTILRKNMEKAAQNYATEIAKLKATKEEGDTKQKQVERQMREEMERLKTQFLFKQHELEASLRRPPSTPSTRVMQNALVTPLRIPSQTNARRPNQDRLFETEQRQAETSYRQPSLKPSPRAASRSSETTKRTEHLPGFQNSFAPTSLALGKKPDPKGNGKELGREVSTDILDFAPLQPQKIVPRSETPIHQCYADGFDLEHNNIGAAPIFDNPLSHIDEDRDSVMLDDKPEEPLSVVEPVKPLNHKAELSRIILLHTHMDANETTFQLAIGLPFITNLSDTQGRNCAQACQSILLALSNPTDDSDYETCYQQVTKHLIIVLRCLLEVDPCLSTIALLNLFSSLALLLPDLVKVLVSLGSEQDDDSLFLASLFDLLDHISASSSARTAASIQEILFLLEIILSNIPDETVNRLSLIPKRIFSLLKLLKTSQSHEILEHLSRIFLLLVTHNSIRSNLSTPITDDCHPEIPGHQDSPLVQYMCTYLLDNFNNFTEHSVTCNNLLGCLAQLSLSQVERLVQSNIVIPTLTYLIAQLSTVLWNDDERTLTNSKSHLMVRFINQTLFLLHHLVYSSEPIIRLHDKLQHHLHRNLSNLVHMFVVSFGLLSYADPPSWIDAEGKAELECLVDIARNILDLAVDGPEGDSVWAAYQMELDNESETDDEEREARLMDNNMQT